MTAAVRDAGPAAPQQAPAGGHLEVRHLEKTYGSRKVVKDVSLRVDKGEVVGLLGPNGAGKTTSFYMIVGLVRCDGGDIRIDDHSIAHMPIHQRSRLGLSYLPQEASIFRKLNVEENVRAVLAKITLGEADAGIVYTSDAGAAADKVMQMEIPDPLNTVASYPIAVLGDSPYPERAQQFVDYVLAPQGQQVLAAYGFIPTAEKAAAWPAMRMITM